MSVNGQINLTETDPTDPTGVYRTLQDCIAHRVNHSLSTMADEADDQGC
eukprot:00880.XXX_464_884_1 [CDS] Oithona nana genome sequencing.